MTVPGSLAARQLWHASEPGEGCERKILIESTFLASCCWILIHVDSSGQSPSSASAPSRGGVSQASPSVASCTPSAM